MRHFHRKAENARLHTRSSGTGGNIPDAARAVQPIHPAGGRFRRHGVLCLLRRGASARGNVDVPLRREGLRGLLWARRGRGHAGFGAGRRGAAVCKGHVGICFRGHAPCSFRVAFLRASRRTACALRSWQRAIVRHAGVPLELRAVFHRALWGDPDRCHVRDAGRRVRGPIGVGAGKGCAVFPNLVQTRNTGALHPHHRRFRCGGQSARGPRQAGDGLVGLGCGLSVFWSGRVHRGRCSSGDQAGDEAPARHVLVLVLVFHGVLLGRGAYDVSLG